VKMRRRVIVVEHGDHDPVERAEPGHRSPSGVSPATLEGARLTPRPPAHRCGSEVAVEIDTAALLPGVVQVRQRRSVPPHPADAPRPFATGSLERRRKVTARSRGHEPPTLRRSSLQLTNTGGRSPTKSAQVTASCPSTARRRRPQASGAHLLTPQRILHHCPVLSRSPAHISKRRSTAVSTDRAFPAQLGPRSGCTSYFVPKNPAAGG
jgi:hypothetical protein